MLLQLVGQVSDFSFSSLVLFIGTIENPLQLYNFLLELHLLSWSQLFLDFFAREV